MEPLFTPTLAFWEPMNESFAFATKNLQNIKWRWRFSGRWRRTEESLSNVLLWLPLSLLPSFACLVLCHFLGMLCIFVKILIFFCLSFFFFFSCLVLSCENFVLWWPFVLPTRNVNSISSQRPPQPCGQIALSCHFLWTLFRRSSTLSVVFQVNGINVEPCTHKEVVSTEVIYYFPPLFLV